MSYDSLLSLKNRPKVNPIMKFRMKDIQLTASEKTCCSTTHLPKMLLPDYMRESNGSWTVVKP